MHQRHADRLAANSQDPRAVTRCSRVLNYDLARWITELRPQLQAKQQSLQLEIGEMSLPPVLCDRQQLRQVLINLITTAHTLTDAGGHITVRARAADRFITIEVNDSGASLASGVRRRDVEPFVRRIVEAHGGSTAVRGCASEGHTFAFTIPVHRENGADVRCSAA